MNILVIQNRMGIGDMVIFLPFIQAISDKYNSPVTLLVKESTKVESYTKNLKYIKKIIYLKRSSINNHHSGLSGFFNLKNEIKKVNKGKALEQILPDTWISKDFNHAKSFIDWVKSSLFYDLTYNDNDKMLKMIKDIF